jgi:hypothetical protein
MPKSNTPPIRVFPYRATEVDESVNRYSSIPTVEKMRSVYLFGIPLKSTLTGQEVSDEMIQTYIDSAISEIEHELSITITPTTYDERHTWDREMWQNAFGWVKVNQRPIIQVNELSLVFSNDEQRTVRFPNEFLFPQDQDAAIQVVPAVGTTMQGFLLSAFAGSQLWAIFSSAQSSWPGAVRVIYKAGFEAGRVPALITGLIGNLAALKLLTNIAPLLFPYSSYGLGLDGASQSVSLPGPQFLVSRISDLEKQIEKQLDAARGYYLTKFLSDYI